MKHTLAALCLFAASAGTALAADRLYQGCLNGAKQIHIMPDSGANPYIEGNIRFSGMDLSRNGVTLYAGSDGHRRTLFRQQAGTQNFLLWLPESRQITLTLEAAEQPRLCYELRLRSRTASGYVAADENAHPQSPRLQALLRQPGLSPDKTAAFWRQIEAEGGTPLVEPLDGNRRLITFLWRGARHNVRLIGGPANDHEWLQRLPGSDIWFKSFTVTNDIRLSYRLAPDIPRLGRETGETESNHQYRQRRALLATLRADPLNPHRFDDASLLDLNPERRAAYGNLPLPSGRLKAHAFASTILGNQRRIWIYQTDPAAMQAAWLYLFDGHEYLHKAQIPAILDQLRRNKRIPPLVAVLIDNADANSRRRELPPNPDFADMLVQELIPFAEKQTGLKHDSRRSVLAGSSYGGLAAAYIASKKPQYFSGVLPMSGSFWWPGTRQDGNGMAELYARLPRLTLSWHIGAGRYETARSSHEAGILDSSRALADILQQKGYPASFRKYPGGHDYALWQQMLADGLQQLLPEK